jgi:hypothetical protein
MSAALLVLLLAGCQQPGFPAHVSAPQVPAASPPAGTSRYIGVYEHGVPYSWDSVQGFAAATGVHPGIALYYSSWREKFWTSFADDARAHGAIPLVQIQPDHTSLRDIAGGRYDQYLRAYAKAVQAFGHPVILSFGHEMNGTWYSWGAGYTTPAAFRAAWRHVVDVFRGAGAANVTWLWTVNSTNTARSPLGQWWPGAGYVDWVGIDGYYYRASDTFASVFGTTAALVRTITRDPILISETAIGPAGGPGKIKGLFDGIRADHLLGLVWFDKSQHDPPYHQDWRLEDSPAALAAFRSAAAAGRA